MYIKRDKVRIKRIVLDLHDAIADSILNPLRTDTLYYIKQTLMRPS